MPDPTITAWDREQAKELRIALTVRALLNTRIGLDLELAREIDGLSGLAFASAREHGAREALEDLLRSTVTFDAVKAAAPARGVNPSDAAIRDVLIVLRKAIRALPATPGEEEKT